MGIGGGLIVVPSLIYALPHVGVAGPDVPKIATATSLALVIPTALASAQAHAARGAVSLKYAAVPAPAIMIGAFGAAALARFIDGRVIIVVFAAYAAIFAWGLLRQAKAKAAPRLKAEVVSSRWGSRAWAGAPWPRCSASAAASFASQSYLASCR